MSGLTVVLGYGVTGKATVEILLRRGQAVRVGQRRPPTDLPAACDFVSCDVLDAKSVRSAVEGASQIVLAVGFPYDVKIWRTAWPTTMANILAASAAVGARLVFVDNLYQLGPQARPRTEDMPLTDRGGKAGVLAQVTKQWRAESAAGRVRVAALRCSDFYGPGVSVSHLGSTALAALANGKAAMLLAPPDTPHDFAYVPDIGRAVVALLNAPDDAYGQVWNMPCAPIRTPRDILRLGALASGVKLRLRAVPLWLLPVLGLASTFMREVADVAFTWDRPYEVDGGKFARRFSFMPTPFEIGVPATVSSFVSGG